MQCVPSTVQDQSVWIQVHHLIWHRDVMHGGLLFVHKVHIRDPDPLHDFCVQLYDVDAVRFVVLQAFVNPTLPEVEGHRVILQEQDRAFIVDHSYLGKCIL